MFTVEAFPSSRPSEGSLSLIRPLTRIPRSGLIGLIASAAAIALWVMEQLSGLMLFELLTIPFKLVMLAAPLLFLPELSARLHRRPLLAFSLYVVLVVTTLLAILAYLPWRQSFTAHFGNHIYRWYHEGSTHMAGLQDDFSAWQTSWARHTPHKLEAGLLLFYYALLIGASTLLRLSKASGAGVAILAYGVLFLVPNFIGLVLWDYDVFLKGIAFDSISLDLHPLYFWFAGDHSIFLYVLMLIFFAVTALFVYRPFPACPERGKRQ